MGTLAPELTIPGLSLVHWILVWAGSRLTVICCAATIDGNSNRQTNSAIQLARNVWPE